MKREKLSLFKNVIIFFLTCSFIVPQTKNVKKIKIYFLQEDRLIPVAITKKEFWKERKHFDTVIIESNRLISRINNNISELESSDMKEFSVSAAFIRYNNQKIDTLYSDVFLEYWDINNKIYKDKSEYFGKMFKYMFEIFENY